MSSIQPYRTINKHATLDFIGIVFVSGGTRFRGTNRLINVYSRYTELKLYITAMCSVQITCIFDVYGENCRFNRYVRVVETVKRFILFG